MLQFLCEACTLSVLGGLIGLVLSFIGVQIYNAVTEVSVSMNRAVGGGAIAFCALIGIAFADILPLRPQDFNLSKRLGAHNTLSGYFCKLQLTKNILATFLDGLSRFVRVVG